MRKNDTQMKKSELLPFHIIKACGNSLPSVKESPINQRFQQFWEKNGWVFLFP